MPDEAPPSPAPTCRRLRFSLASLLWLVVVVSLLLATTLMWLRLRRAEQELEKYGGQFGYLSVTDPQKIHAIGLRTHGSLEYCWKLYLPPGRKFYIVLAHREIPDKGFPSSGGDSFSITGEGETLLFAGIKRKSEEPSVCYVECNGAEMQSGLNPDWAARGLEVRSMTGEMVRPGTSKAYDPDQSVVLLRMKAMNTPGTFPAICDGLMVWIAPLRTTSAATTSGSAPVVNP